MTSREISEDQSFAAACMLSEFRVKYVNFIISRVVENWSK